MHVDRFPFVSNPSLFNNCSLIDKMDPSQVFKSNWIRPEDTGKYKEITALFKISGRTRDEDWINNTTKAYLNGTYEGNILDLMDSNLHIFQKRFNAYIDNARLVDFHTKVTQCDKNCNRCNYCESTATKLLKFK